MRCARCGEEVMLGTERCGKCGAPLDLLEPEPEKGVPRADSAVFEKPLFSEAGAPGPPAPEVLPWSVHEDKVPKTPTSFAGGALILAGGILSVLQGAVIISTTNPIAQIYGLGAFSLTPLCGTFILLFGLVAIVGGILGVMRRNWGVVVGAAVLCLLSVGWFFLSLVLGFMGLMMVAMTKDEFD